MTKLSKEAVARLEEKQRQRAGWKAELAKCQRLRDALNSQIDWLVVSVMRLGDVEEATDADR